MPRVKFNKELLHLNLNQLSLSLSQVSMPVNTHYLDIGDCRDRTPKKSRSKIFDSPWSHSSTTRQVGRRWKEERGRKRGHTFIRLSLCDHRAPQQNHQTMAPVCLRMCVSSQIRRPALCLNVSPHLLSLLIPPCCCSFFPPPLFSLSVELRGLIGDERESR